MLNATEREAAKLLAEAHEDLRTGRVKAEDVRELNRSLRATFGERYDAIRWAVAAA